MATVETRTALTTLAEASIKLQAIFIM